MEPVAPPQQTTPTGLKIKLGPSPKTSPVVLPAAASTQPLHEQPDYSPPQQPTQSEHHYQPEPVQQQQQQQIKEVSAEAHQQVQQQLQPKPKKQKLAKAQGQQQQQWPHESDQQLQEQALQEPKPKKRKQAQVEGGLGQLAQAPQHQIEGPGTIKLKLGGSFRVTG